MRMLVIIVATFQACMEVSCSKFCREANTYVSGTRNFKNTNLKCHSSSVDHCHAVVAATSCITLHHIAARMISTADAALITVMRNVLLVGQRRHSNSQI